MTDVLQVRGVAEEVQRKAKSAAASAGMTLGKWMTLAIEKGAREDVGFREVPAEKNAAETPGVKVEEVYRDEIGVVENVTTDPPLTVENIRTMKAQLMGDAVKPARKPRKVCAHGMGRGENCWQCGGAAKIT